MADTMTPTDQSTGWDAAAAPTGQPATPDATPQAPPQQTTVTAQPGAAPQATATPSTDSQGQIAATPAPDYTAPPRILTPLRPGIMGVVDKVLNAIAGTNKPEMAKDQEGNVYVKNTSLTRGEQWQRVAGEALVGAAKGLAAGRGAGNMGAAAAAGVDAGTQIEQGRQQQAKDMTAEARQQTLDNANNQMLRMKMAEQAMTMAAMKTKATEENIKFADEQTDRLVKEGGTVLGTMSRPDELRNILKVNPDVMQDMIQKHQIEIMPHYNPDGSPGGFKVIKMPDGYRTNVLPAGTIFHTFDETSGQYVPHKTSSPITQGEIDDYEHAAGASALEFGNKKAIAAHTAAETAASLATAGKAPSEINKNNAEAANARAEAVEHLSKAKQQEEATGPLVDQIGLGKIVPERLSYLLARNPQLLQAVTEKYPDFDGSKAAAYPKVYDQFTSTKKGTAGGALNAGGTALGHLQELQRLNTVASHIPGTPAYNAYQNKADTLATELATFYGDPTVPAIASIKKTLTSTLPGNRDAAIKTQAQSMGDKFDEFEQQWKNAAPSKYYEAPMPNVDKKAMEVRAALDPAYRARQVAEQGGPADMVTVTLPGKPPGQIPRASLDKFKKENPNATIQ